MRVFANRPVLLLPFVTAAVLLFATNARAADPVTWRTDYNAARREAAEKGLPIFLVIGTDNCFYCRKLEAGPFRESAIVAQLVHNFIPLKVDANKEPNLARALKVQVYPTMVLASADGKIHAFIEGYLEAERLEDHLKRAITVATTTDWAARDYEQAGKALAVGRSSRESRRNRATSQSASRRNRFSTTSRRSPHRDWRARRHSNNAVSHRKPSMRSQRS
jgi:thioredoxin-related protein